MKLSDIISGYMHENKLSARSFAKQCGLSNSYISLIVNENTKSPTLEALKKISNAMAIDVNELINSIDEDEYISVRAIPEKKELFINTRNYGIINNSETTQKYNEVMEYIAKDAVKLSDDDLEKLLNIYKVMFG